MTAEAVIEGVKAVGAIITPIAVAYIAVMANRTHKAVNSTALALAEVAKAKDAQLTAEQDKNSVLARENARLRQMADGKQVAQDLKDAGAL